jgi:hypothetical protein
MSIPFTLTGFLISTVGLEEFSVSIRIFGTEPLILYLDGIIFLLSLERVNNKLSGN